MRIWFGVFINFVVGVLNLKIIIMNYYKQEAKKNIVVVLLVAYILYFESVYLYINNICAREHTFFYLIKIN
jgi:hypothetical protein